MIWLNRRFVQSGLFRVRIIPGGGMFRLCVARGERLWLRSERLYPVARASTLRKGRSFGKEFVMVTSALTLPSPGGRGFPEISSPMLLPHGT